RVWPLPVVAASCFPCAPGSLCSRRPGLLCAPCSRCGAWPVVCAPCLLCAPCLPCSLCPCLLCAPCSRCGAWPVVRPLCPSRWPCLLCCAWPPPCWDFRIPPPGCAPWLWWAPPDLSCPLPPGMVCAEARATPASSAAVPSNSRFLIGKFLSLLPVSLVVGVRSRTRLDRADRHDQRETKVPLGWFLFHLSLGSFAHERRCDRADRRDQRETNESRRGSGACETPVRARTAATRRGRSAFRRGGPRDI